MTASESPPPPRRILITGAARGIGFATAVSLARRGHTLLLAAHRPQDLPSLQTRILQAVPNADVTFDHLDLASFASIHRFAQSALATAQPIHVLLHNAGLIIPSDHRCTAGNGIEENLAVAAVGPMLLSLLLQPVLARPSRLIGVNSALHKPGTFGDAVAFQLDDPNLTRSYTGGRAYKNAKLAQLWFLFEWERRFAADGLHADAISPGFVPATAARTAKGFQRFLLKFIWPLLPFATRLDQAATCLTRLCESDLNLPGGRYFESERLSEPSPDALSEERAKAFWTLAESWIKQP